MHCFSRYVIKLVHTAAQRCGLTHMSRASFMVTAEAIFLFSWFSGVVPIFPKELIMWQDSYTNRLEQNLQISVNSCYTTIDVS